MNCKKILLALILAVSMLLSAVGCADSGNDDDGVLNIVCTVFPQYDFARTIAGDAENVNIKLLLGSGQESHDYDPSSRDIAAIHDCDIFIYVGGESDSWVKDLLSSVDVSDKTLISMMDEVDTVKSELSEGMESEDHGHGAVDHVEYDEHVWTSPANGLKISEAIAEAMVKHFPENEELFRKNFKVLSEDLDELGFNFRALVNSIESPTVVVADRFPLLYFCREYGIEYFAAFPGCAASTEPSSKTVQFLIEKVKSEKISAVFKMDLSSGNVAATVAEETGAKVLTFYSCHTVSAEDFAAGETYVTLMRKNYAALAEALGAENVEYVCFS